MPKFYQKVDSNKTVNVSLKSISINSNSEPAKSDNQDINGFYWKKKLSLCMLISCQEKKSNKCGFENSLIIWLTDCRERKEMYWFLKVDVQDI